MNISIFQNMTSKQPLHGTLEGVANLIRTDEKLKVFTASYRQTGSKTFKSECQLFAVACTFEGGKGQEHIKQLTGLSLVDFDHILSEERRASESEERRVKSEESPSQAIEELKKKIIADPHTLMCYTTISGNGLRIIYRYEIPKEMQAEKHLNFSLYQSAFFAGNAYYERLLGIKSDAQCKNITRLSGLAHDPDVFLRPEAVAFSAEEIAAQAASYAKQSKEHKQIQRIQTYYDTLIAPQLAKANILFAPGSHNEYVMRVGYKLAEHRFSKNIAIKWAKQIFAAYADTEQVFTSCFANATPKGNAPDGRKQQADNKTAMVGEIKSFLDSHIKLRYNEITARVEYLESEERRGKSEELSKDANLTFNTQHSTLKNNWLPINDRKVNSLWAEMSQATRVNRQELFSVIESEYVPTYNPFKAYFDGLDVGSIQIPTDGTDGADLEATQAIKALAKTVCVKGGQAEQDRWYRYLKKWLVAMVAAWDSDKTVNNVILVLIGEQGAYKTTWFNYLLPPELKRYFYTKTNANRMSKDDLLTLAQYGLVCCEELDTMRPAELNQLKAVVTMPSIDERAAYAHFHEHRKHIASFCGTGNNPQFLTDPTGNRRWLPFEVENIVSPREHPFDHDAIYAEAYALYKSGFKYWFEKDEIQELNKHNRTFETPRLERELVDLYFRKPGPAENGIFMTAGRAMQIIGCNISQKLSAVYIGRAFVELGFERVRARDHRGYLAMTRTAEEMKAFEHLQAINAKSK